MRILALALLAAGCAAPTATRLPVEPPPAVAGSNPPIAGLVLPTDRPVAAHLAAVPTLSTLARLFVTAAPASGDPYTLFAPTDEAFGRLAPGTLDALAKAENRAALAKLLRLHIVAGRLTAADLIRLAGQRARVTTLGGEPLSVTMTGPIVTLTDGGGNRSYVEIADVRGSDGLLHLVNGVLVPRLD